MVITCINVLFMNSFGERNSRTVTRHFQEVYIWTAFTYKGGKNVQPRLLQVMQ